MNLEIRIKNDFEKNYDSKNKINDFCLKVFHKKKEEFEKIDLLTK